jgi:hypothetical protein
MTIKYRIEFERIGRNRDVEPLAVKATNHDDLVEQVYWYARPHLGSRDVDVYVDLEKGTGGILCGFNSGGRFTVTEGS